MICQLLINLALPKGMGGGGGTILQSAPDDMHGAAIIGRAPLLW